MMTMVDALGEARKALLQVDRIEHTNWFRHCEDGVMFVEACAWCHKENGHTDGCQREVALAAIEEVLGI